VTELSGRRRRKSDAHAPDGARSACAKRAAYPDPVDPPPVAPHPESLAARGLSYTDSEALFTVPGSAMLRWPAPCQ
jgi:hypothetical protein